MDSSGHRTPRSSVQTSPSPSLALSMDALQVPMLSNDPLFQSAHSRKYT